MNKPCKKSERIITLADVDKAVAFMPKEHADNAKRQLRKPLLTAYDTHKTAVIYEDKAETAEEKKSVLSWKQDILDLKTESFKNIPPKVKYYLRGER